MMKNAERKIVVISPIKNEEWILEHFIKAASIYADHIVISDHSSTDKSVAIAKKFPKVRVIASNHTKYAEAERRNELLIEARKFGEGNVILAIDADEFMSPSAFSEARIKFLKNLEVGTRIGVPLWNIKPGFKYYWTPGLTPVGFVDDGSLHDTNNKIHFPRIPQLDHQESVLLKNDALLHFQFIQWDRMESKHRWYKTWETINFPNKSALEIFRRYDHMNILPKSSMLPFDNDWLAELSAHGVDLQTLESAPRTFWWDKEVLDIVAEHGLLKFKYLHLDSFLKEHGQQIDSNFSLHVTLFDAYLWLTSPLHRRSHYWPIRLGLRFLDSMIGSLFKR